MERNNLQPSSNNNPSFVPNFAHNAEQQQGAQPQGRAVPPLGNAPDLYAHPPVRNLQDYRNVERGPDTFNLPEYQPVKPGEPYMEKQQDESLNTKIVETHLKHAQEHENLGLFQDAEKTYKKALKYTDSAEHYKLYGECLRVIYLNLSQIPLSPEKDEAQERVYKEKAAKAFYYLGNLYEKQADWQEAQTAYKASHELACHEVPLQALVAVARQVGEKADIVDALEKLADFYVAKGDTALAIKMLEEAVQVEKSFKILQKLELLCGQAGGKDSQLKVNETRIQQFELQISEDPNNIGLYRKYSWFLKDLGKRNEARAVKERMDELLQQKLVKQKTRIGSLKVQVKTFGQKVEFLERQVIHLDFSSRPDIQNADLVALLNKNPYIKSLSLAGCKNITDTGLASLKGLTQLKSLDLSYCNQLMDAGLHHLKGLTQLTSLNLSDCDQLMDVGLQHLAGLTQLRSLNLYECCRLGVGLQHLAGLTQLKSLDLTNCNDLSDASLQHLKALTQLTSLNLYYCSQLTDAGFQHLAGLTQLTSLNLSDCYQLTDAGLEHLASLTQLKSLDLYDCCELTDGGLQHLAGLTQLTTLNLSSCDQLTDASLQYLAGLTQLTSLNLDGCAQISRNAKEQLKKQIPGLEIKE